jgi:hypothetical protein
MILNTLLVLQSIIIALCRICGMKGKIFQATSHLFIGGLIGAAIINHSLFLIIQIIGLCIVELLCFFLLKDINEKVHTID